MNATQIIARMDSILDELIQCQREEQESILSRESAHLPLLCGRIVSLGMDLEKSEIELQTTLIDETRTPELEKRLANIAAKFSLLQELALQNHMLLESSLHFIEDVYREVFGGQSNPHIYNQLGIMAPSFAESGVLINAQA
jgi:flagellar biosynthesis/type III secretory pathway chaperone